MSIKNTLKEIFDKYGVKEIGEYLLPIVIGIVVVFSLNYLGVGDKLSFTTKNNESLEFSIEQKEELQRIIDSQPTVEETYYDNGQIETRVNYQPKSEGGLKHGISEEYYENGSLYKKYTFQNGKRHGPYERYFENGRLEVKTNFENDKLHGPYERYSKYSSKRLELKTNFKNGRLHGSHEIYWEDGSLNARTTFEDGIDIGPCVGVAANCRQAQNFFIIQDYIFLKD